MPRRTPSERFIDFKVTGYDKLVLNNPKYKLAINNAAARAANMLRDRISKQGKDSNGQKLPQVAKRSGWYWTGVHDPRFRNRRGFFFNRPWERAPLRWVYWRGYRQLKGEMNKGRTWRGAGLTGQMWKNLEIQVKPGTRGEGSAVFRLHFAKSQRVGLHPKDTTKSGRRKAVSVRNRTKAQYLQYAKRSESGQPYHQTFVLMEPSRGEKAMILKTISQGIRFANR